MPTIKKSLRQFAEWGTELGAKAPDIFTSARFQITFFYFFSGVIILVATGIIADSSIYKSIHSELLKQFSDTNKAEIVALHIINDMKPVVWLERFIMIVALGAVAYILSGITLKPIRRALESQRRFVSNASHELRTPLAIMKTNSDVALISEKDLTKSEAVDVIHKNLEEIERMTNDLQILLSFSGYENRISGLLFSRVDLYAVAAKVVHLIQSTAEIQGINISLSGEPPVIVRGNAAALEEMITNLVRNAIAYTDQGGSVRISVCKDSKGLSLLTVQDSGIGIHPEDLPHIFEPFYRGENAVGLKKVGGGAGLGLAIVREIAKLHRAKIDAKSEIKAGSIFSVRFSSS